MKNPVPITLYVSEPMKVDLQKMADEEDRSVAATIRRLIEEALANRAYQEDHQD